MRLPIKAALCAVTMLVLQGCAVVQYRPDVAIGTGRAGGVYFPLGDSVCRFFNHDLADRGLKCSAELSGGPIANINSLREGRVDIGIVESDVLADAVTGRGSFAAQGRDDALRVLFTGHTNAFTIVARRGQGIRAVGDLRGKRVNVGNPGSGERVSMERVMAALGFAPADFSAARELPRAEQHDAFCRDALDASVFLVPHPNGVVEDAIRTCGGVLVNVSGPQIENLLSRHPEYSLSVIPGNTYSSNSEATTTIGVRAAVITTTRLSELLAYEITKAVFENIDDFRHLHPDFATLSPTNMVPASAVVPLHPGAARYYRARGWLP